MSVPSFPGSPPPSSTSPVPGPGRGGAGDHLPTALLAVCGVCTLIATGLSVMSIILQLKNYRMPALQRCVVRIMVMVPLYALSSYISLYSLNAAFFIDAVRDLYEGFVIYTFLQLLITYLGGERELLLRLRGRPPIPHAFPFNLFLKPMDPSDPWTLLNLKRGVLQYVQVKPILVIATAIFKATGTYHEGEFKLTSGYTYVSIVYNFSICLSLYCLAMFWVAVSKDLKPFRPVPKFLCVKGILFFSFWQGILIGFLVSIHAIKRVGPYTDPEHMTLALVDSMICLEMPFFALAHQYAFEASDYIDPSIIHAARLPFIYAFRDAFGLKDVWEDAKYTLKARGVSYKAYEAADGGLHYGEGRQKRIKAGLRYSKGGQAKYWIPVPGDERTSLLARNGGRTLYTRNGEVEADRGEPYDSDDSELSDAPSLDFSSPSDGEEEMYARARRIGYSGFPNVDVSREQKQRRLRDEEDGILAGRRSRRGTASATEPEPQRVQGWTRRSAKNRDKGKGKMRVYGAWADRVEGSSQPLLEEDEASDAAFDGENENPDAWRSKGDEGLSLKWSRKPPPPKLTGSPFNRSAASSGPSTPQPRQSGERQGRKDAVDIVSEATLNTPSPMSTRPPPSPNGQAPDLAGPTAADHRSDAVDLVSEVEVSSPNPTTQTAPVSPIAPVPIAPPNAAAVAVVTAAATGSDVPPPPPPVLEIVSPHDEEPSPTMPLSAGPALIPEAPDAFPEPPAVPDRDTASAPPAVQTHVRKDKTTIEAVPGSPEGGFFPPPPEDIVREGTPVETSFPPPPPVDEPGQNGHRREPSVSSANWGDSNSPASIRAPSYRWSDGTDNPWA